MKKGFAILFAVFMLVSVLAGCAGDASSTAPPASTPAPGSESTAEPAEPATGGVVKVWLPPYKGGDAEYTDEDFWNDMFDKFEQENNCTVEVTVLPWSGYDEKVATGLTSGEGPDVVYLGSFYDLAVAGALEPLDAYFSAEEKDNYIYWDMGFVAGDQYVLPMMVGNANVLYCNMDILAEADLTEVPKTWDDLISYSKAIEASGANVTYPFMQPWGNPSGKSACMTSFLPYFWQAGGEFLNADGNPNLDSDAGRTTLEFLKSLLDEGVFDDTIVAATDPADMFRNGETAMVILSSGTARSITEAGINWDFATLEGPNGDKGIWVAGDSLAVPANGANKEMAVKAMKYMTSAEVMDAFHEQIFSMPNITKDATHVDDERFADLYENQTADFHPWPFFENSDAFYDTLFKNIQSMYMGDMTVEGVIENTMSEYMTSIG
ncbi:sugar ABC transporter substrate-binding protein [Ruminococcaceae bacterium OttesenSCG-928-D13]|nr:sugar ABC transporter substrate-binding protein [Ruminococcaceae bacterium OttesenSCG-928-D13]